MGAAHDGRPPGGWQPPTLVATLALLAGVATLGWLLVGIVVVLILVLVFRPSGLLGERVAERS